MGGKTVDSAFDRHSHQAHTAHGGKTHTYPDTAVKSPCPSCGAPLLARSRARNLGERVMKRLGRKAYRCLACGWRGVLHVKAPVRAVARSPRNGARPRKVSWWVVIVISLLLAACLVLYTRREPPPPSTAEAPDGQIVGTAIFEG